MPIGKLAAVLSSLKPAFIGRATKTPLPRAKTPTTPGLGDKMRTETSKALESLLKKSAFQTGLEDVVKAAALLSRPSLPTARVVPMGSGVRTPPASAAPVPSNVVSLPPLSHPAIEAARALPGRMLGPIKRGLGL